MIKILQFELWLFKWWIAIFNQMNHYPVYRAVCFDNTCPLDCYLSNAQCYPPFEQYCCVRGSWILGMLQTELLMYEIQHSVIVCSFGVIMMHQRNSWIYFGHWFISSFDTPWSEWSWSDPSKGTHPKISLWLLLNVNSMAKVYKVNVHVMLLTVISWICSIASSSSSQEADAHIQTTEDC